MNIRDFVNVRLLEEVMEEWSKATGMATIAMDSNNEYLTKEIGFTDFCTKYTRGTKEGLRRCTMSDAYNTGVYYCHAGLMDFSVDICLNDGTYLGKVIGGQILAEKPDEENFRKLALEIGIDQEKYINALSKIEIRSEENIRAAVSLLGRVVNLLVNAEYDRTKQEKLITRIKKENTIDSLTGVYNKSILQDTVKNKIKAEAPFALIITDIDDFKEINDTYGHMAGDTVLKMYAREMKKLFRSTDIVGRFGGDEFYFIIDSGVSGAEKLEHFGKRICEIARKMNPEGVDRRITVSVGIASWPKHGHDGASLFQHADKALYNAKENGKDCYFIYGAEESFAIAGTKTSKKE